MSLPDASEDRCECGGELERVIVQNSIAFEDENGKNVRVADSEEVWRCADCNAEYTFGDSEVEEEYEDEDCIERGSD